MLLGATTKNAYIKSPNRKPTKKAQHKAQDKAHMKALITQRSRAKKLCPTCEY